MTADAQLEPTVFVIFGGAGDLAWRKLIPALFDLFHEPEYPGSLFDYRGGPRRT